MSRRTRVEERQGYYRRHQAGMQRDPSRLLLAGHFRTVTLFISGDQDIAQIPNIQVIDRCDR